MTEAGSSLRDIPLATVRHLRGWEPRQRAPLGAGFSLLSQTRSLPGPRFPPLHSLRKVSAMLPLGSAVSQRALAPEVLRVLYRTDAPTCHLSFVGWRNAQPRAKGGTTSGRSLAPQAGSAVDAAFRQPVCCWHGNRGPPGLREVVPPLFNEANG